LSSEGEDGATEIMGSVTFMVFMVGEETASSGLGIGVCVCGGVVDWGD